MIYLKLESIFSNMFLWLIKNYRNLTCASLSKTNCIIGFLNTKKSKNLNLNRSTYGKSFINFFKQEVYLLISEILCNINLIK